MKENQQKIKNQHGGARPGIQLLECLGDGVKLALVQAAVVRLRLDLYIGPTPANMSRIQSELK